MGDVLMADTIKCPQCSANLIFNPDTQKLECAFCGGAFDPSTIESTPDELLEGKTRGAQDQAKAFEGEKDSVFEAEAENAEFKVTEKEGELEDNSDKQEFVCNACGARVVTDSHTSATFCAFCGSPALVTRRLSREFKPDYIIPFKLSKEEAVGIFEKHCDSIDHLPRDFSSKKVLSKMTGLYVPTWVISTEVTVDVVGTGYRGRMVDSVYSDSHVATSEDFMKLTYGKVKFRLKDVPFDGEKKIANRLIAAAEPFDYSELIRFRPEFLQGFLAEKYDELPIDMTDRIYRRLDKYALQVCDKVTFGYDGFEPSSDASIVRYNNQDIKYTLLPCWFLSLDYDGRTYQYIVNGQTGKVSGEFPYSKGWETVERTGRKVKIESVSWNSGLRRLLYLLPLVILGILRVFSGSMRSSRLVMFIFMHPVETLIIGITISLTVFFLAEMLPKILLRKEKEVISDLSKSSSHDLAPEPDVSAYYDPSFPVTAYETTKDFISLETGWKYGEMESFDFKTAMPEAEKAEEKENATVFEELGKSRQMLR